MKIKGLFLFAFLVAPLVLGACGGNETSPIEATPVELTKAPTESLPPTPIITPTETATPTPTKPDSTRVEFQSADGTPLVGYYYPAAVPDAPIVVLMHWAGGDQTDWNKVGLVEWLRNLTSSSAPLSDVYVPMPDGQSFSVFTFDYRGYGESGGNTTRNKLVDDSIAALNQASKMEGVDPLRVSAIGSSIGADGAADSCVVFPCVGVLSLSPGSYLGLPYNGAVDQLDANRIPVWCVASEGDWESAPACKKAGGDRYNPIIYPGNAHGTEFLVGSSSPAGFGQVLLDWLLLVYKID